MAGSTLDSAIATAYYMTYVRVNVAVLRGRRIFCYIHEHIIMFAYANKLSIKMEEYECFKECDNELLCSRAS